MRFSADTASSIAVCIAAATVVLVAVHREFAPASNIRVLPPVFVKHWQSLSGSGTWIGDSNAPVRVVEFADFECPFCRQFHQQYTKAKAALGDSVALLFVQFPLSIHKFASGAARASLCAKTQGRFEAFANALYGGQDSLGLKAWSAYARNAGIVDSAAFNTCVNSAEPVSLIAQGLRAGDSIGVRETPTVIINGLRYSMPPTDSLIDVLRAAAHKART